MKKREMFFKEGWIGIEFIDYTESPKYEESWLDPGGPKILVSGHESSPQPTEEHQFIEWEGELAADD